jgi:VCBS repeat-containing protein
MNTYYEVIDAEAEHDEFPSVHRFLTKQHYHEFLEDDEWAYDVEEAARQWAEKVWSRHDYADEMTAIVTGPDGTKHRVVVTVEARPYFHAREVKI